MSTRKFMVKLVDAGFGLKFESGTRVLVTANSGDSGSDLDAQPSVKIEFPKYIGIRFYPNQNKRTGKLAPKNPPRVKPNYIEQKLDTMEEYRDYLYDRYNEHLKDIQDKRKEKIDDRLARHADLLQAEKEVQQARIQRESKSNDTSKNK